MKKYIKILVPSFIFFVMLEFFFRSFGLSYASLITLFLISVLSAFWITKYRFLPIVLIILFTTGSVLFLVTLSESWFQQIYIAFSSFLFALALIGLYRFFIQQKRWMKKEEIKLKVLDSGFNLNQAIILISIFLISSGIYSLYLNLNLLLWNVMLIIFITIFFSTIYLIKINFLKSKIYELHLDSIKNKTFFLYSFLLGFIIIELIWAMSFLPVNHLTVGAIVLLTYYTCWNILRNYLKNELSKKIVVLNSLFFLTFFCITLLAENWKIV